jgi:hypothetical protein
MFVAHVVERHPNTELSEAEKTTGAEDFFDALVRHLPQLRALDKARKEAKPEVTTGMLRKKRGGDVALRGVGLAIFARAFLYCKEHGLDYDVMASKLALIEWHLLNCEKSDLPANDPSYKTEVYKNAQPLWAHLLVVGEPAASRAAPSSLGNGVGSTTLDRVQHGDRIGEPCAYPASN